MADNIVGGLFGVDPAALQRQQQLADQQTAYRYAQLNPMEQAKFSQFAGGAGLARAAGGLLGMEDPELAKASKIKQIASQVDLTSSEGLRKLAAEIKDFAPQEALMAAKRADEVDVSRATVYQKTKEAQPKTEEIVNMGNYQRFLAQANGDTQLAAQLYRDDENRQKDRRAALGASKTILPAGESEFVKQLGKNDAGVVTKAMETRANAVGTLQSLDKLGQLNDNQLISGTFAEGRVGAANLLNTLGLASKDDVARISSSQQYSKVAKDVVFQTLGSKLGAGFSNEDRAFVEALIPKLETSPEARRQLITYMRTKNQLIADESTRLENYARENNGLKGFKYSVPRETLAPMDTGGGSDTKSKLEAEMKKRKLL